MLVTATDTAASRVAGAAPDYRVVAPIAESAHRSSPAYRSFLSSKPFSRANEFLESRGRGQVEWELPDLT